VEAAIASVHAAATNPAETQWDMIVSLYDTLMQIRPSPVVALNRALAIAQRDGPAQGLEAIRAIDDRKRMADYPFYAAAVAELGLCLGHLETARNHFLEALALARNPAERRLLSRRIAECDRVRLTPLNGSETHALTRH